MAIATGTALLIGGLISAIGGLAGTGLSWSSMRVNQDFNREEAEKARQFSHEEAALNRDFEAAQAEIQRQWQTDMSNSAYQRSMADMEAAGINPNILSQGALGASTGNASTPQGSQAQSSAASSSVGLNASNMFAGLSNALNAYATIKNQELIAQMYNDNSRNIAIMNNSTRRYGIDETSANFQQSVWKYRHKKNYSKNDNGGFEEL